MNDEDGLQPYRPVTPGNESHDRREQPAPDYIPAINLSTRSSTERNGSLHSTVRCA